MLPMRNGLSASRVVLPHGGWPTILAFLSAHFAKISPTVWQQRMRDGLVLAADGQALPVDAPYVAGQTLFYYRQVATEARIPVEIDILHQDEHLLVIDKPHFLPVSPVGRFVQETVLTRLKQQLDLPDLVPIHRLDRETAGVMLLSKQVASRDAYQRLFRQREVQKCYEAVASYRADMPLPHTHHSRMHKGEPFFIMQEIDGAANSETRIELIQKINHHLAHYRLSPKTGQQHQLRVHLAALGLGILHDPFYPVLLPDKGDDFSQPLQLLARSIAFIDPISQQARQFASRRELAALSAMLCSND